MEWTEGRNGEEYDMLPLHPLLHSKLVQIETVSQTASGKRTPKIP